MEVPYRRWTRQEDAQLVGNRRAGVPWRQIARMLGRSRQDCKSRLKQLKDANEVPTVRITENEDEPKLIKDKVWHTVPKPPITDDSADKGRLGTITLDKPVKPTTGQVPKTTKAGSLWPEYFAWQLAWIWFVQHGHWCRFPKVSRGSSNKMMGWGPGGTQTMKHIEEQHRANVLARIRLEQACAVEPREAKLDHMEATTKEVADRIRLVLDEANFAAPNKGRYQKLGAIIGCDHTLARKYCLGLVAVNHLHAVVLSDHFKVNAEWLVFGKGPKYRHSEGAVDDNNMDKVKAEMDAIEKLMVGRDIHNVHVWISTLRMIAKLLEVRAPQSSNTLLEIADYFDQPEAA